MAAQPSSVQARLPEWFSAAPSAATARRTGVGPRPSQLAGQLLRALVPGGGLPGRALRTKARGLPTRRCPWGQGVACARLSRRRLRRRPPGAQGSLSAGTARCFGRPGRALARARHARPPQQPPPAVRCLVACCCSSSMRRAARSAARRSGRSHRARGAGGHSCALCKRAPRSGGRPVGSPRVRCAACCSQSVPAPRGGSARPCGQDAPQRHFYVQVCKTRVKPSYAWRRSALSLMRMPSPVGPQPV